MRVFMLGDICTGMHSHHSNEASLVVSNDDRKLQLLSHVPPFVFSNCQFISLSPDSNLQSMYLLIFCTARAKDDGDGVS